MKALWVFVDYAKKHEIMLSPIRQAVKVAVLLAKCHCCHYRDNQISEFFLPSAAIALRVLGELECKQKLEIKLEKCIDDYTIDKILWSRFLLLFVLVARLQHGHRFLKLHFRQLEAFNAISFSMAALMLSLLLSVFHLHLELQATKLLLLLRGGKLLLAKLQLFWLVG